MVKVITADKTVNAPEMTGFVFTGKAVRGVGLADLPLYEFTPPAEGHLSINTLEGWEAHRYKCCARDAERKLGRKPTEEEIRAEMEWNAAEGKRIVEELMKGKELPEDPKIVPI